MSPRGGIASSWAAMELGFRLREPARAAGHAVYGSLTVLLEPTTWIESDLVVLAEPVVDLTWVPADKVLMPVEFVSPSASLRDRINKSGMAAEAGIPYYLLVEVARQRAFNGAVLHLFELAGGSYTPVASACAGERFRMVRPFELDFDPAELLEP